MLRKSQLTHVRQVASQPEIEQLAHGLDADTNDAGLILTNVSSVYAFEPDTGTPRQPRPLAPSGYALAQRGHTISPTCSDRPAKPIFPTDQPTTLGKELNSRCQAGVIRPRGMAGGRVIPNATRALFQLQNHHSLTRKRGFAAGDAILSMPYTGPALHSQAVLQGPGMGRRYVVKQKQKDKFM